MNGPGLAGSGRYAATVLPRLLLAVLLLVAACGDAGAPEAAPATPAAPATSVEQADPAPSEPVEQADPTPAEPAAADPVAGTATPSFDGPPAPDFALPLENRDGTFVLSEAATPVYLTFWAEW